MIACRSVLLSLIAGGLLVLGCTSGNAGCPKFQYQPDSNQNTVLCHDPLGSALVEELCKSGNTYSVSSDPLRLEITDSQEQRLEQVLQNFLSKKVGCWGNPMGGTESRTPLRLTRILADYFHWEKQNGNFILKPQVPPTNPSTMLPSQATPLEFPRVPEIQKVLQNIEGMLQEIQQYRNVYHIYYILITVMSTLIFIVFLAVIIAIGLFLVLREVLRKEPYKKFHSLHLTKNFRTINQNFENMKQTITEIEDVIKDLRHKTDLVTSRIGEIQTKLESIDLDKHLIKSTDHDSTPSEPVPTPEPQILGIQTLIEQYNLLLGKRQLEDEFKETWKPEAVNFNVSSGNIERIDEENAICWEILVPRENQLVLVPARRLLTTGFSAVIASGGEGGRRLLGDIFDIRHIESIKDATLEEVTVIEPNPPHRIRKKGSLLLPSNLITT